MGGRHRLYVIAYDVADDRRRRRIAHLLEEEAARVQESLFERRMTPAEARHLFERLRQFCGLGDSVRLYPVPDAALPDAQVNGGPEIAGGGRYWLI